MSAPTKKTAKEISDIFISTMESQLGYSIPLLPRALIRIMAKMLGIVFVVIFQYSEFIAMQLMLETCSDQPITIGGITYNPLDVYGNLIGYTRLTGSRTEGPIAITAFSTGGTLLAGSQLLDSNTGEIYLTIGDVAINSLSLVASVRALNYSTSATLYVGQTLSFVSAPVNIDKTCTVSSVTVQGADPEDSASFRQRQLNWWAARPQGGAVADYREWGSEVAGVENVYPFSGGTPGFTITGPGYVDVYIEASETTDGIAPQALIDAVFDNIEMTADSGLADRRPINAKTNVGSISRVTFSPVVTGLTVTDETAAKAAIETAMSQYMLSRENYILGLSRLPRKDTISDAEAGGIVGRVVASYGGTVNAVEVIEDGIPVYVLQEGEKAKLGTITWI